jgi:hypothetical protein
MAPIDVEKTIEELTLGEKVALTAGKSPSNAPPCLAITCSVLYTPPFRSRLILCART